MPTGWLPPETDTEAARQLGPTVDETLDAQARLDQLERFRALFATPEWPALAEHFADQEEVALEGLLRAGDHEADVAWRTRALLFRELRELPDEVTRELEQIVSMLSQGGDPDDA